MRHTKRYPGFSLIELMLAGALFVVFSWGVTEVLLAGLSTDRLGAETAVATEYANAGIEAVRSIKAKDFAALANTDATGVGRNNGEWEFAGSDNSTGKYTRVIAITDVNRNGDGTIDESGGDPDPDTKKVTVTVSFDVTTARSNSIAVETYLTRFNQ